MKKLCNLVEVEGVAQLAEYRVVAPGVVGSSPIALPIHQHAFCARSSDG